MGQLSTLELAIIICFGSAVGDPMMGKDIPITHGLVVITAVALLQIGTEWLINRNRRLEVFMEGRPECLVMDGLIINDSLNRNSLSREDLFRFLRNKDIEHLGQVKNAFFETSGLVSVWCFSKSDTRAGLGILPKEHIEEECHGKTGEKASESLNYSCLCCGYTRFVYRDRSIPMCPNCTGTEWQKSHEP